MNDLWLRKRKEEKEKFNYAKSIDSIAVKKSDPNTTLQLGSSDIFEFFR